MATCLNGEMYPSVAAWGGHLWVRDVVLTPDPIPLPDNVHGQLLGVMLLV